MICMRNALRLSICGAAMPASLTGGRKKWTREARLLEWETGCRILTRLRESGIWA
jgi:hypothetical protein